VAGNHKEEVLGILKAEVAGNHKAEARGFEEGGIGSTTDLENRIQIDVLLCPPYPTDQMYHSLNLKTVSHK
jgi:hypothetical protein